MDKELKKVWLAVGVLLGIGIIGTLGYIYIEGYTLTDALYMTAITLSTVGFGEVSPLSPAGRLFTSGLIFSGISVVIYAATSLTTFFVEGEMRSYLRSVKMNKKIEKLRGHYIIAGNGRTGRKLIEEFTKKGYSFVVIEKSPESVEGMVSRYGDNLLYVMGDATDDEVLKKSGIEEAGVLLTVLSTDADNLFVTLSAKDLNKDIRVITRAVEASSEGKLRRAGADKIISPLEIAANRMFATATQSEIVSFLDVMSKNHSLEGLNFASVPLNKGSELVGSNLREAKIPQRTNLIVIGIEKEGEVELNPRSHTILNMGDKLLVLGNSEQIAALKTISE